MPYNTMVRFVQVSATSKDEYIKDHFVVNDSSTVAEAIAGSLDYLDRYCYTVSLEVWQANPAGARLALEVVLETFNGRQAQHWLLSDEAMKDPLAFARSVIDARRTLWVSMRLYPMARVFG